MVAAGMNQADLALKAGVSQAAVSKWLKGTIPKGDQLHAIAISLFVTMEWLLTGQNPGEAAPSGIQTARRPGAMKALQAAKAALAKLESELDSGT